VVKPKIILQGNKFYEISIRRRGENSLYFRDTLNWMCIKLSSMIETFGLEGLQDKPFFPYLYNRKQNLGKSLSHLPPPEAYCYSTMTPKNKTIFDKWYEDHKKQKFVLSEELAKYCLNDVEILTHAVVKLKNLFEETTKVDILRCNTIASSCMKAFRMMLKDDDSLALITEKGYGTDKYFSQSDIARKWLRWYSFKNQVEIQDCETREKWIPPYRVDGFIKKENRHDKNDKDLVLEVHGYEKCCLL
jgi:hypothetical protein